jgi:hypothetical protein
MLEQKSVTHFETIDRTFDSLLLSPDVVLIIHFNKITPSPI